LFVFGTKWVYLLRESYQRGEKQ
jgi:hypothetical protein